MKHYDTCRPFGGCVIHCGGTFFEVFTTDEIGKPVTLVGTTHTLQGAELLAMEYSAFAYEFGDIHK